LPSTFAIGTCNHKDHTVPRARYLKPGFFRNETLADMSFAHRLLFAGLWTLADRLGRLEDRPKRIKPDVFPYDTVDVHALLGDLAEAGLIVRYVIDGNRYIEIPTFLKHQRPHPHEPPSTIPKPPELDKSETPVLAPAVTLVPHGQPTSGHVALVRSLDPESESESESESSTKALASSTNRARTREVIRRELSKTPDRRPHGRTRFR
jgi:hypothetical protein